MILEGLVTTISEEGVPNIAPMGPHVADGDLSLRRFVLRPYVTSTTFRNLKATGEGVLHVTDDALLLALGAIGRLDAVDVEHRPATHIRGVVLTGACRYHEFRVVSIDESTDRAAFEVETIASATFRDFFGFNRAKHAVLEAAILATRTAFLPPEQIRLEFDRLAVPIAKTGGDREKRAMAMLREYVERAHAAPSGTSP